MNLLDRINLLMTGDARNIPSFLTKEGKSKASTGAAYNSAINNPNDPGHKFIMSQVINPKSSIYTPKLVEKFAPKPKAPIALPKEATLGKVLGEKYKETPKITGKAQRLSPAQINQYINNILKYAGAVDPNSPERSTPEKAKQNSQFIKDFATQMLTEAPNFDIDPRIITAIHMAESGWGGTRKGNNLGGFGIMGELDKAPTVDKGYRFIAPNMNGAVRQALRAYKKSGYSGIYTPEGFAGRGKWNSNGWIDKKGELGPKGQVYGDPNWLGNLQGIMNMIYK